MNRRQVARYLLVLGILMLPAPQYLGWVASTTGPPAKTSQIYAAEPIDLANESDQQLLVREQGDTVSFADYQLAHRDEETFHSKNATREAVESVLENGSATVTDDGARRDMREIDAEYEFLRDSDAEPAEEYHRLTVLDNGSTVRAESVSIGEVATVIVEQAPRYESLTAGEQETVDRIKANSTEDDFGFRPRVNEPYVDQLPTPIWQGETLYSIHSVAHADGFGPGFGGFIVGLGVAGIGLLFVIFGGVLYLYERLKAV